MNAPTITKEELTSLVDFASHEAAVTTALTRAGKTPLGLVRLLSRYTSWNGYFGSAVASLSGKLGRCRGYFLDPEAPLLAVADRSVYIASYFFDAARDEFDDRDTVHRDTHRCLAQSTLLSTINFFAKTDSSFTKIKQLNAKLAEPKWLLDLNRDVARGYGAYSTDSMRNAFHAMGYHLGSELLADSEFSLIDSTLKAQWPKLVKHLQKDKVKIAGQEHLGYAWVQIHSGHGSAVEADHFKWASSGALRALRFTPAKDQKAARRALHDGFRAFAADHRKFFSAVNTAK
ncbi:MAG: hypothetical protein M3O62_14440 [Pseudomonadota bacterium]|nr:hypothetical protein [Pseudomonadota bacterium]